MTGKPKPEFVKPLPAMVKLAGGVARSIGLGVMELTPRVSLTVSEMVPSSLYSLVAVRRELPAFPARVFNDGRGPAILVASVGKGTVRLVVVPEVARAWASTVQ